MLHNAVTTCDLGENMMSPFCHSFTFHRFTYHSEYCDEILYHTVETNQPLNKYLSYTHCLSISHLIVMSVLILTVNIVQQLCSRIHYAT